MFTLLAYYTTYLSEWGFVYFNLGLSCSPLSMWLLKHYHRNLCCYNFDLLLILFWKYISLFLELILLSCQCSNCEHVISYNTRPSSPRLLVENSQNTTSFNKWHLHSILNKIFLWLTSLCILIKILTNFMDFPLLFWQLAWESVKDACSICYCFSVSPNAPTVAKLFTLLVLILVHFFFCHSYLLILSKPCALPTMRRMCFNFQCGHWKFMPYYIKHFHTFY